MDPNMLDKMRDKKVAEIRLIAKVNHKDKLNKQKENNAHQGRTNIEKIKSNVFKDYSKLVIVTIIIFAIIIGASLLITHSWS